MEQANNALIIGYIVVLLMVPVMIWLQLRLSLCSYALARMPDCGAVTALKAGFLATKHHVGRVFGMVVATFWPFMIVFAIIFFSGAYISRAVFAVVMGLVQWLYGAYIILSLAGLSEVLLAKVPNLKDTPVQE